MAYYQPGDICVLESIIICRKLDVALSVAYILCELVLLMYRVLRGTALDMYILGELVSYHTSVLIQLLE